MRIHFVGIKGISMSRLAQICAQNGIQVSGSDENLQGHDANKVKGADLVVYSSAIPNDNPEIRYAITQGIPLLSRAEFLGKLSKSYDKVFAVCGCHGKTTTCAMLYSTMKNLNPTLHLGGKIEDDSGNGREIFITEACEYKRNFLSLSPDYAIFTNIDFDHPDCYKNINDVKDAYSSFYDKCSIAFINADDKNSKFLLGKTKTVSFGFSPNAEWRATGVIPTPYGYSFEILHKNTLVGTFRINLKGVHNIYNALASSVCAMTYGVSKNEVLTGLENFQGVMRRNEYLYSISSTPVFADYAHHPREISSQISTLKNSYKKVLIIFQPHTFSRTKSMFSEFVRSLSLASEVWILPTYSAREKGKDKGTLFKALNKKIPCSFLQKEEVLQKAREKAHEYDAICFMGAGDIYDLAKSYEQK